jgi:hypothetical protein
VTSIPERGELKPCPTCGDVEILERKRVKPFDEIECPCCGWRAPITHWNRRAPWKPEEIEALKGAAATLEAVVANDGQPVGMWLTRHEASSFKRYAATLERMIEERS